MEQNDKQPLEDSGTSWTIFGLLGLILIILGAIYLNGMHKHQVGKNATPSEAEIQTQTDLPSK